MALNNEYCHGLTSTIFGCKPAFIIIESSITSGGETSPTQKSLAHRIHPERMSQEGFEGLTTAAKLKNTLKYLVGAEINDRNKNMFGDNANAD